MACAHVAHDCVVGDHVVLANNVLLAGFVSLGPFAVLGGGAAYHQFTRVGESAMVGGLARITLDIPPFVMAAERDEVIGLNLVGLKRRGFAREAVAELKDASARSTLTAGNVRHRAQELLTRGVRSAEARKLSRVLRRGPARHRARPPGLVDGAGGGGTCALSTRWLKSAAGAANALACPRAVRNRSP